MKNVKTIKKPDDIVEESREKSLDKDMEGDKNLNFSPKHLDFVNSINKQKKSLLDFFNEKSKKRDLKMEMGDDYDFDILDFDGEALIKKGKEILEKLQEYRIYDRDFYYDSISFENVDTEKILFLLQKLEEIKDKIEKIKKLAEDKILEINDDISKIEEEKRKLEKLLNDVNNKALVVRLFKKNKIKELEENISDLNIKILEQKEIKSTLNRKRRLNLRDINSTELLLNAYFSNIRAEVKDLENSFLSEEVTEKMNEAYINKNVMPYLFNHEGNEEYLSGMDDLSQEEKESYLRTYKKYLSLSRGSRVDTHDLSPKEKEEHEKNIEIFNKVEHKITNVYSRVSKVNLDKFNLYQSKSNDSFNKEYRELSKNFFSFFYNLEKKKIYSDLKNSLYR